MSDPHISDSPDSLESGVSAKNPPELRRIYVYFFDWTAILFPFDVEVIQNPGDIHYHQSQSKQWKQKDSMSFHPGTKL